MAEKKTACNDCLNCGGQSWGFLKNFDNSHYWYCKQFPIPDDCFYFDPVSGLDLMKSEVQSKNDYQTAGSTYYKRCSAINLDGNCEHFKRR